MPRHFSQTVDLCLAEPVRECVISENLLLCHVPLPVSKPSLRHRLALEERRFASLCREKCISSAKLSSSPPTAASRRRPGGRSTLEVLAGWGTGSHGEVATGTSLRPSRPLAGPNRASADAAQPDAGAVGCPVSARGTQSHN